MPIYEYVCEKCQKKQEIIQKFSEKPAQDCTLCQSEGSLRKIISNSSFHLKGGGWYKDLYSSPKEGTKTKSASKPS